MQSKRGELIPVGKIIGGLSGPVQALIPSPPAQRHFTRADQVNQLVGASEAEADLGFMARMMALCSLPRTNPGNRLQYKRVNGPFTLYMTAGGGNKLPYGNLPRLILAWVSTEAVRTQSRVLILGSSLSEFMRTLGPVAPFCNRWSFLCLLLLPAIAPAQVKENPQASKLADWSRVQALSPGVITRVQLDKNEAPSGGRKIKGFFSSATDTSITLLFADGRTRTIEKRVVRTVRVRRPFKKRYTGFVIGAAVAVGTGILYGRPGGDISPLAKFLIPVFYTVPATVAGFFMMPTKLVYRAQQTP